MMKLTLRLPDHLYRSVKAAAAESQPPLSINQWMIRAAIVLLRQEYVGLDVPPQALPGEVTEASHED